MCVWVCTCVRVLVYMHFLCLNKGGEECGRGMRAHVCSCVEQKNVRPVKSLEIQLNYTTMISLTRERVVLQLRVIFVIIKLDVLFKTTLGVG